MKLSAVHSNTQVFILFSPFMSEITTSSFNTNINLLGSFGYLNSYAS
nr:MAG TPA: hypothetical protein [Caudoviricetes sp.]